ncbi:MAG: ATP-grasp domain-containing protein, partial [Comamonas sp.]|nr:ATP-grasp domain-containing protein [Candidatus Comamonas equi]
MEITRSRALRGPNLWSRNTATESIVHCAADEYNFMQIPRFEEKLRARFPAIGGLHAQGMDNTLSLAHVLEAAALALQAQAGCLVTFSRTHATVEEGTFQVVVEYTEEAVGKRAVELAEALIQAALQDTPFDAKAAITELHELDEEERVGPSTGSLLNAAIARGIPYRRLTAGSLVQLGWGSKARKFQAAEVDQTSSVAEPIAQDKDLTKRLLHAAGVPVPMGRPAKDLNDAWLIAEEVGLPVVVKPQDGNQGKGVTVNITTREQLEKAYATAMEFGTVVMVERFLPGHDFRLLVVGNQLVSAARRDPPQVLGDGEHTIRELVDIVNQDPRRGTGHGTALTKIRLDDIAIARIAGEGLTPESIPAQGQRVVLRNNANLSTGGSATDVTDDVHPDIAARAIEAAACVGLHICGVDVVCETMLKPLQEQNGGIVEVNAAPGLRMHLAPSFGKPRNVGVPMVDLLFANGEDGRIPVVAVTGTNGKTTTTRLIAHIFATQGLRVGMTNTDGVYVNGRQID